MAKELVCECGNDKFYISNTDRYAMCAECNTLYTREGKKMEMQWTEAKTVEMHGIKQ